MRCILCKMPLYFAHHGICSECVKNLPRLSKICPQCGLPHSLSTPFCYRCRANKPDIITCVPLHHVRYWSRGFNQAEQLAKPMAKWLNREFCPHLLQRKQIAPDQKNLSLQARASNVEDLFTCNENLTDKSIMLIDDIVTTGNTVNAISQQLKKRGAKHVQVICLCRTVL